MAEKYISIREKPWKDLKDNDYIYKKGDSYPREGLKPNKKRIEELLSTKNKLGEALIAKVEEEVVGNSDNMETEEITSEE